MSWYFAFISPLAEGTISATIVQSRPSRLTLTGPTEAPAEIGSFVADLGDEVAGRLQGIVKASDYMNQPASGPVPPETALLSMGEGKDNDPPNPFRGFVYHQRPPAIQPVIDEMARNITELRQHPHHIVRAEARWEKPAFPPRGDLVARVRFYNPGTEEAVLFHPGGGAGGQYVTTMMVVARDVGTRKRTEADVQSVPVEDGDVVALDAAGNPVAASPDVAIGPGAAIEFEVRRKGVFLSPGRYEGRLVFRFVRGDLDPKHVVYGTLAVPVGPFTVS